MMECGKSSEPRAEAQPGNRVIRIVGGGLAGCEAAWQAAARGHRVLLHEMRPEVMTPAHRTGDLAELVCSNSLGSGLPDRATGILQAECRRLDSLLMRCATACAVPAGGALAVDREAFARAVTEAIESHPGIRRVSGEVRLLPEPPSVVATGPLTSPAMSDALAAAAGRENLFFYDAIAPVVEADSLDRSVVFSASRYGRGESGEGDYLNCPMTGEEYDRFVAELSAARRIELRPFEAELDRGVRAGAYFEGCLPVEVLAARGPRTLAFGPMRPVGLRDPRTGLRPHAVLQLRRENLAATQYNLVGFQTNLAQSEQARVFRMIPGLGHARFARYGQMHRNTYLRTPGLLTPALEWIGREGLFLAGQVAGVEGYMGSVATGWLAGVNAARYVEGKPPLVLSPETMLGAICRYVAEADPGNYQPVKANLGLLPPLEDARLRGKDKAAALAARAVRALAGAV